MKVEDLEPDFKFYSVEMNSFKWYVYIGPMPYKSDIMKGSYHLLLKRGVEPVRMYKTELQNILNEEVFSVEDVRKRQIKLTQEWLKYLKSKNYEQIFRL